MIIVINGPIGDNGGVAAFNQNLYKDALLEKKEVYKLSLFNDFNAPIKKLSFFNLHRLAKNNNIKVVSSLFYGIFHIIPGSYQKIQVLHGFRPIFSTKKNIFQKANSLVKALFSYGSILIASKFADITISNSYLTKAFYRRIFGLDSKVIPIFFKTTLMERKESSKNTSPDYDLLFVGRLVRIKNIDYIFLLMKNYENKFQEKLKLCIVGDGAYKKFYEDKAKAMGLSVSFMGHIDNTLIYKYYQNTKIFISLSDLETFGLVISEASSYGTKVFTVKYTGILEFLPSSMFKIINMESIESSVSLLRETLQANYDKNKIKISYEEIVKNNLFIKKI